MRAIGTLGARKPSAGRLAIDVRRAFLACGLVLTLCLVAALIAGGSQVSISPASRSGEADLSTGSMLVVTSYGELCRERTIDNNTWKIRNKGWVDCDEALAKSAGLEHRSTGSRLDIIRESFRGKP